ncbi:7556_t:CDS:2, partial [Racocetra fulgida]
YNSKKFQISQQEHLLVPTYQVNTNQTDLALNQLLLNHLIKIRQMPNIMQFIEYAKKAIDYAIQAYKIDELVNQLENFIEKTKKELFNNQVNTNNIVSDPIRVNHKGRQPKRYKSGGKTVQNKRQGL